MKNQAPLGKRLLNLKALKKLYPNGVVNGLIGEQQSPKSYRLPRWETVFKMNELTIGKCCWCEQVKPIRDRVGHVLFCGDCLDSGKSKAETMAAIDPTPKESE